MRLPKVSAVMFRACWQGWIAGGIVLYLYVWVLYRKYSGDGPLSGHKFWEGFIPCALVGPAVTLILAHRTMGSWKSAFVAAFAGTIMFYGYAAAVFAVFIGFILLILGVSSI